MQEELDNYLHTLLQRHHNTALAITNAEVVRERSGDHAAIQLLINSLQQHPSLRGIKRLLEFNFAHYDEKTRVYLAVINNLVGQLLIDRPLYCCSHCGFTGKSIHWQCPSCKSWNTVRPSKG